MQHDLNTVLGIDAAWTDKEPSGIALLEKQGGSWLCRRLAPSYEAFCRDFEWSEKVQGSEIDVSALLDMCRKLSGVWPGVVAVDMPLSNDQIDKRRNADNEVSRQFGHCRCSVHSPTSARPGATGRLLQDGFRQDGYSLVTQKMEPLPALLEVYPHVALLGLTDQDARLPYKVGRTRTYWPALPFFFRRERVFQEWKFILGHLRNHIKAVPDFLPDKVEGLSFQHLKRYEDAIDALVCAWVAIEFVKGNACPMGDEDAAIWIPATSMKYAKRDNEKK